MANSSIDSPVIPSPFDKLRINSAVLRAVEESAFLNQIPRLHCIALGMTIRGGEGGMTILCALLSCPLAGRRRYDTLLILPLS